MSSPHTAHAMVGSQRGAFIVVEGLDRSGKSTQCDRLCAGLENEGHKTKRMRFPDRTTPIGKSIDAYLKGDSQVEDHVIHLLFSANRWEAAAQIRDDIAKGVTIVADRYYYSGVVYSAAKCNPGLTLEWAWQPEVGLPQPDLCIFLDISQADAAKRGGFGVEKYENSQMQRRVREMFNKLLNMPTREEIVVVAAGQLVQEVEQDVMEAVRKFFESQKLGIPLESIQSLSNLSSL